MNDDTNLQSNTQDERLEDITPETLEEDITFEADNDARENTAHDAKARVDKLKAEIEKLKAEKQQYLDGWQRDKAEFINARKRDEESKADFMKFAAAGFVEELLPIIDSFEAALKQEGQNDGVIMIHNQFKSVLKKQGIEEFGNIGEMFDPAKHQAIGNIETKEADKDHTLAEILQKGYSIHGKVIRPAFVKVFQVN